MAYPSALSHVSSSISQLMVEQVLKLGSLTESRFFLLVEDPQGRRRVMGDNALVRSFASGALRPQEEDSRLELDPTAASGILEKPVNTVFEDEETPSGNKRPALMMENEFHAKRAKTDENGRMGTHDGESFDDESNIFVDKLPQAFDEDQFRETFSQFGTIKRVKLLVDKRTGVSKCNGFVLFNNPTSADQAITEMNGKVLEPNGVALYVRKAKENRKNLLQYWPGLQAMANPAIMAMATGRRQGGGGTGAGGMGSNGNGMRGMGDMMGSQMASQMAQMAQMGMGMGMGSGGGGGGYGNYGSMSNNNPYAGYTASGQQGVEGVSKHTLFVYNLSHDSTELDLYNLFGKFGAIIDVHLQRDNVTGASKGFGFVAYAEYQQATAAIQAMDGYLYEKNNYKPLQVSFKNRKN